MNKDYKIIRATEEYQRAGAYYVRIYAMNRAHHISLREEFDDFDNEKTKYIVILDDEYPIATARFYETSKDSVTLGRVVVIPEYRGQKLGKRVVDEAEKWIKELGYTIINIDSRIEMLDFYKKLGYSIINNDIIKSGNFDCIKMHKTI